MFILSVYEPPTLAGGRYTSMELLYDHLTPSELVPSVRV